MTCHYTRNEGNLDEGIVTCLKVWVSVTALLVSNRVTYVTLCGGIRYILK